MRGTITTGRPATEKQIAYVTSLAEQVGKPVPANVDLTTWTSSEVSTMIDTLKALVPADAVPMATERQREYLRGLLVEREWDADDLTREAPMVAEYMVPGLGLESKVTAALASAAISFLKVQPRKTAPEAQAWSMVPDGHYATTAKSDGHTSFYQVYTFRDGNRGVSVQASDDYHTVPRVVAESVLAQIAEDVEAALARYGREIGKCGVCNRTLTQEDSIARGIGPVCAGKLGF